MPWESVAGKFPLTPHASRTRPGRGMPSVAGYRTTYDPLEATLYGNVSASLNLEGSGAFNALDVMPGLAKARLDVIRNLARRI